jgi:sulfate/thiosulfate transport system ATP-binding protein
VAGFIGEAVRMSVEVVAGAVKIGPHSVPSRTAVAPGAAALFVRPRDLVPSDLRNGGIPTRVTGVRRAGPARRAELQIAEGLPSVEIELPPDLSVTRGEFLHVQFRTLRLFPDVVS